MQVCKQCGQAVQDVETYCPRCGSSQLIPDSTQRVQRPPAMPNSQGIANNTVMRQPQPAPPGYRNPNVPNGARQMQRPPMNNRQTAKNVGNGQTINNGQTIGSGQNANMNKLNGGRAGLQLNKATNKPVNNNPDIQQPNIGHNINQNQPFDSANFNEGSQSEQSLNDVTFKEWIILMIKMIIPFYNIYTVFHTIKGKDVKPSMREYMKAALVFALCSIVLSMALSLIFTTIISNLFWYM